MRPAGAKQKKQRKYIHQWRQPLFIQLSWRCWWTMVHDIQLVPQLPVTKSRVLTRTAQIDRLDRLTHWRFRWRWILKEIKMSIVPALHFNPSNRRWTKENPYWSPWLNDWYAVEAWISTFTTRVQSTQRRRTFIYLRADPRSALWLTSRSNEFPQRGSK